MASLGAVAAMFVGVALSTRIDSTGAALGVVVDRLHFAAKVLGQSVDGGPRTRPSTSTSDRSARR